MEGKFSYGKVTVNYILPQGKAVAFACYFHGTKELAQRIAKVLEEKEIGVFAIEGEDWNRDLSPWEAAAVFRHEAAFAGGAETYLAFLCQQVIPQTETALQLTIKGRSLMGYSLAGLFAVYAMYETDLFTEIASVSGSLWYDGFIEYMKGKEPCSKPDKVYFSLGKKEKATRNLRMARVEACTTEAKERLEELGISCYFEMNPGNHFYQAEERMERAVRYLYFN